MSSQLSVHDCVELTTVVGTVEGHFYEPIATASRTRLASESDVANKVLDCMRSIVPECFSWDAFTIDKPEKRANEIVSLVRSMRPPDGFGGWVHFRYAYL